MNTILQQEEIQESQAPSLLDSLFNYDDGNLVWLIHISGFNEPITPEWFYFAFLTKDEAEAAVEISNPAPSAPISFVRMPLDDLINLARRENAGGVLIVDRYDKIIDEYPV